MNMGSERKTEAVKVNCHICGTAFSFISVDGYVPPQVPCRPCRQIMFEESLLAASESSLDETAEFDDYSRLRREIR